jgi:hypothetical protein
MLRSLLVLSLLVLPAGAAAQVRVDFDRHQDFRQYRTFDVAIGPLVRADGTTDEQNTLTEDRLRRAIASARRVVSNRRRSVRTSRFVSLVATPSARRLSARASTISRRTRTAPFGCETDVSHTFAPMATAIGAVRSTTTSGHGVISKVR